MAKRKTACWDGNSARLLTMVTVAMATSFHDPAALAQVTPRKPSWMVVPRAAGHLSERDIGLVINRNDPYSVEVGEFYAQARKLSPKQILRVDLPVKATLSPEEFEPLRRAIEA